MRTIKFRGKCCHSDAWAYGNLVDFGEEECPEIQGFDVFGEGRDVWQEIDVERDTIGQFTNLHDKNGTPIFEGDVVRWYSGWDNLNHLAAVQYVGELCQFLPVATIDGKEVQYTSEIYNCCEVVGNVHDNPEMAKGGVER